jgi:D-alanine transaminase
MNELLWIDGDVMPLSEGRVGVEDRGYQFADGVYETLRLYGGVPFLIHEHLKRLQRSCEGIELKLPMSLGELESAMLSLAAQSQLNDGMLYLQVTRGESPRNHVYPKVPHVRVLFYTRALEPVRPASSTASAKIWTVKDERWSRVWIKSISLLPNVLAKNEAVRHGAEEGVFVDEAGMVSECTSSNLFVVNNGTLMTAPITARILGGVTRDLVLHLARSMKVPVSERLLTLAEAKASDEVFITSSIREVHWVSRWDDRELATRCGRVTMKLHEAYQEHVARKTAAALTGQR